MSRLTDVIKWFQGIKLGGQGLIPVPMYYKGTGTAMTKAEDPETADCVILGYADLERIQSALRIFQKQYHENSDKAERYEEAVREKDHAEKVQKVLQERFRKDHNKEHDLKPKEKNPGYTPKGVCKQCSFPAQYDKPPAKGPKTVYYDAWETTLETPYPRDIDYEQVAEFVCRDVHEGRLSELFGDVGLMYYVYSDDPESVVRRMSVEAIMDCVRSEPSGSRVNLLYQLDFGKPANEDGSWQITVKTTEPVAV